MAQAVYRGNASNLYTVADNNHLSSIDHLFKDELKA